MAFLIFYLFFAGSVSAGYICSHNGPDGFSFINVTFAFLTGWADFPFMLGVFLYNLIQVLQKDINDNKKGEDE